MKDSSKLKEANNVLKENYYLKRENEKLKKMIENGLGFEDIINDITYPYLG